MDCGWRWLTSDGSHLEVHRSLRYIATGYRWLMEVDDGGGWWRWMVGDEWQVMDLTRWITGGGWQLISFPVRKIFRLCEAIPFSKSLTVILCSGVVIERRYAAMQLTGGMAPLRKKPSTIQSTIQRYQIMQLMPQFQCWIRTWISSRVTATMPIPHKLYKINLWRSTDL